jgi:hypothetical protein
VQWDPERDIFNQRLDFKSIQVGITPKLTEDFAKRWIKKIEDMTPICRRIQVAVESGNLEEARALLPNESIYPANAQIRKSLGM